MPPGEDSASAPSPAGVRSGLGDSEGIGDAALRVRVVVALLIFAGVAFVHAASPVRASGDSQGTVPEAFAFVKHGTLDVSTVMPKRVWARDYVYLRRGDGAVPRYPIGSALLAVPVVAVAEALGHPLGEQVASGQRFGALEAVMASALVGASAGVLFMIASRELRRLVPSVLLVLVFAFATTVWSDASRSMWQHAPLMLVVLLALWCLPVRALEPRSAKPWTLEARLAGSGALLGLALWVRPVAVAPLLAVAVWAVYRHRARALWLLAGSVAPIIGLAVVNHSLHGTWSPVFYQQSSDFSLRALWDGATGDLVSPSRGALVFEPVIFLAIASVAVGLRRGTFRDLEWIALVSALGVFAAAASDPMWWGGYSYGPRLLTDLVPLVAVVCIPLAGCWPTHVRQISPAGFTALALVGLLVVWSIGVNARGALDFTTWEWNFKPVSVDAAPHRAWQWSDPQFLRGTPLSGYG